MKQKKQKNKTKKDKRVKTLAQLKRLSMDKGFECYIMLAGGLVRSSKNILYHSATKKFSIHNEIDGTWQMLNEKQIMDDDITNIGRAMKLGALIAY